jgi:hypothetical protein
MSEENNWWETEVETDLKEKIPPSHHQSHITSLDEYTKQKSIATGLFVFSFLVGDWWWDGSNGFSSLFNSIQTILEWATVLPDSFLWYTNDLGMGTTGAIIVLISGMLWVISPLVFCLSFMASWKGTYGAEVGPKEIEQRKINGKNAYRFLILFSIILVVMDFISTMIWNDLGWYYVEIWDYPVNFFANNFWILVAFGAAFGLNPENEWFKNRI